MMLRGIVCSVLGVVFVAGLFGCGSGGGTGAEEAPDEVISPLTINNFLWKPKSERNGNLVVLINPENVRIEVTGLISETLLNSGASNGRGTTARSPTNSGCEYGNDVILEFFDSLNQRVLLVNGAREVVVPFGCNRHEFQL